MPAATVSARNNEIRVSVTFLGQTRDLGIFDTWSGAEVTADNAKHRRGGMGQQIAVGGPSTIGDLTITRDYDLSRDHANAHWLSGAVGRARVVASKTYLDDDGIAFGPPIVITGVLSGYTQPDSDSDSGDVSMFGIVVNPDGVVG